MIETNKSLQLQILELYKNGTTAGKISYLLHVPRSTIYKIIKKNRIPIGDGVDITELISARLLCYCEDIEILTKRLAYELLKKDAKKIIIPSHIQKFLKKEKINKVVSILDRANLKCEVIYA